MQFIKSLNVQKLNIDNGKWYSYRVVVYLTNYINDEIEYVNIYKNEKENQLVIGLSENSVIPEKFSFYKKLKVKNIKINNNIVKRITIYITKFCPTNSVDMYYDDKNHIIIIQV